jgi:hypothetical protein
MNHENDVFDDISFDEIYDAGIEESEIFEIESEGQNWTIIGKNKGLSEHLKIAERFVQSLLSQPDVKFELNKRGRQVVLTPAIWTRQLPSLFKIQELTDPNYQFSEHLKLVQKTLHGWEREIFLKPEYSGCHPEKANWELLNDALALIRSTAMTSEFKTAVARRNSRARRQFVSARDYISNRFDWYSRLLVLRVDFGYRDCLNGQRISVEQAKKDLKRFFGNSKGKPSLFKTMVGYICRVEYGADKGVHMHVTLFLNGADSKNDPYLAHAMGAYWRDVITKGGGLFFNCNRVKRKYLFCGIGMINHDDVVLRENLLRAVAYLAKKDQYLRVAPEHGRVFFRGEIEPVPEKRTGRPRASAKVV